jgi:hypothetical protein
MLVASRRKLSDALRSATLVSEVGSDPDLFVWMLNLCYRGMPVFGAMNTISALASRVSASRDLAQT